MNIYKRHRFPPDIFSYAGNLAYSLVTGGRLPRQRVAVLRTFRLGFSEWGVSPAYTRDEKRQLDFRLRELRQAVRSMP